MCCLDMGGDVVFICVVCGWCVCVCVVVVCVVGCELDRGRLNGSSAIIVGVLGLVGGWGGGFYPAVDYI